MLHEDLEDIGIAKLEHVRVKPIVGIEESRDGLALYFCGPIFLVLLPDLFTFDEVQVGKRVFLPKLGFAIGVLILLQIADFGEGFSL